jgi:hypothetical protein
MKMMLLPALLTTTLIAGSCSQSSSDIGSTKSSSKFVQVAADQMSNSLSCAIGNTGDILNTIFSIDTNSLVLSRDLLVKVITDLKMVSQYDVLKFWDYLSEQTQLELSYSILKQTGGNEILETDFKQAVAIVFGEIILHNGKLNVRYKVKKANNRYINIDTTEDEIQEIHILALECGQKSLGNSLSQVVVPAKLLQSQDLLEKINCDSEDDQFDLVKLSDDRVLLVDNGVLSLEQDLKVEEKKNLVRKLISIESESLKLELKQNLLFKRNKKNRSILKITRDEVEQTSRKLHCH